MSIHVAQPAADSRRTEVVKGRGLQPVPEELSEGFLGSLPQRSMLPALQIHCARLPLVLPEDLLHALGVAPACCYLPRPHMVVVASLIWECCATSAH